MEKLGPRDTRRAIKSLVHSQHQVTHAQLVDESIRRGWSVVVDATDFAAENMGAAGETKVENGVVKSTRLV